MHSRLHQMGSGVMNVKFTRRVRKSSRPWRADMSASSALKIHWFDQLIIYTFIFSHTVLEFDIHRLCDVVYSA